MPCAAEAFQGIGLLSDEVLVEYGRPGLAVGDLENHPGMPITEASGCDEVLPG